MPRLQFWTLRSALLHIGIGFLLGAAILANRGIYLHLPVPRLLPMHVEELLVGGTVQFAMGVGFWMLSRFSSGAERREDRWGWLAFGLINAGVVVVGTTALLGLPAPVAAIGRGGELLSMGAYVVSAWPRVTAFGN